MKQLTDIEAERAFDERHFHLMDKATFLSISKRRTEQAGFLWDNTSGERQGLLYDHLMQTIKAGDTDYIRNLEAVKTGAMVKDAGADTILLREKLIRVNRKTRWYDLTPNGREYLQRGS